MNKIELINIMQIIIGILILIPLKNIVLHISSSENANIPVNNKENIEIPFLITPDNVNPLDRYMLVLSNKGDKTIPSIIKIIFNKVNLTSLLKRNCIIKNIDIGI